MHFDASKYSIIIRVLLLVTMSWLAEDIRNTNNEELKMSALTELGILSQRYEHGIEWLKRTKAILEKKEYHDLPVRVGDINNGELLFWFLGEKLYARVCLKKSKRDDNETLKGKYVAFLEYGKYIDEESAGDPQCDYEPPQNLPWRLPGLGGDEEDKEIIHDDCEVIFSHVKTVLAEKYDMDNL